MEQLREGEFIYGCGLGWSITTEWLTALEEESDTNTGSEVSGTPVSAPQAGQRTGPETLQHSGNQRDVGELPAPEPGLRRPVQEPVGQGQARLEAQRRHCRRDAGIQATEPAQHRGDEVQPRGTLGTNSETTPGTATNRT